MNPFNRAGTAIGVFAVLLFGLSACGGGGGSGAPSSGGPVSACGTNCGSAMLTMTDAQGDFLNYVVTLQSLQLKKANGAVVETLPKATQIDFAQLVDLSEVLSVGQIPAGEYVGASITVDYTGSVIKVDDGTGAAVQVSPVDGAGAPITQITLAVQLDNKNHLAITPGRIARLAFDFNLKASNTVDVTAKKVTVQPFVVATAVPPDTKQIRVRGALVSVDTANSDYIVNILPFHEASMTSGQVTVHTTAQTTYEIDGTAYTGAAGLTALAALPATTMTAAFGSLQTSDMTFSASRVLAGSSIQNKTLDHVSGSVIARAGNVLTVRGLEIEHHDGGVDFEGGNVTVNVASATTVTEEGKATGTFDIGAISVGQRVDAFGTMSRDATTKAVTLDATAGRVRLNITPIWGVVTTTTPATGSTAGSVTMNLQAIDDHPVSIYNFAGTGSSAGNDAKASSYIVNTQSLPLAGLVASAPTRMFGFVTPFGSAHPDFVASTLVDYSAVNAQLIINWGRLGTTAPFSTLNASGLVLDLTNPSIGLFHELDVGPLRTDLTKLPAGSPQIVGDSAAMSQLFSIGHAMTRKVDNFNSFGDFVAALTTDLNGSTVAYAMTAQGHYDTATGKLSISRAIVALGD